jgi:hypothetical protein
VVNKSTREREGGFHYLKTPTHGKAAAVHNLEIEDIVEEHVNAAMAGDKKCKRAGIGKDNLLYCRWLGEKGACCFEHPASEIALKGKGVSKDSPNPGWLTNGKKAFHSVELPEHLWTHEQNDFYDSFQTVYTGSGGGADENFTDE